LDLWPFNKLTLTTARHREKFTMIFATFQNDA
jgi:hypothetical protein